MSRAEAPEAKPAVGETAGNVEESGGETLKMWCLLMLYCGLIANVTGYFFAYESYWKAGLTGSMGLYAFSGFSAIALLAMLMFGLGRAGFVTSAALLYLAVFTSLAAVTCALDSAVAGRGPYLRAALAMGLPLAVSLVGFEGIVDGLYAPAGLACLMLVLAPLALRRQTAP